MEPLTNLQADQVEIIYYTDPLCCWSWAVEPQIRRLLYEYKGSIKVRYCMGGLLPNWESYHDDLNDVSKPIQMGPVWMHARQISGMPMDANVWMRDPPISSYPACIAVKCAFLQSDFLGEKYLRLLREAIMLKGANISRQNVLTDIAATLVTGNGTGLNLEKFEESRLNDNGLEAFRKDLLETQSKNIRRFPTLVFKSRQHKGILLTGYFSYATLVSAISEVCPTCRMPNDVIDKATYKHFWGSTTERELKEVGY